MKSMKTTTERYTIYAKFYNDSKSKRYNSHEYSLADAKSIVNELRNLPSSMIYTVITIRNAATKRVVYESNL